MILYFIREDDGSEDESEAHGDQDDEDDDDDDDNEEVRQLVKLLFTFPHFN